MERRVPLLSDREKDIKNLENTHPDIAKQQWVCAKNEWRHSLNGRIDGKWFRISNLGDKIQWLYGSNTKIGQEMADTLLNTIRENLVGWNEYRKENTIDLLAKDPKLKEKAFYDQDMKKIVFDHVNGPRMPLLYVMSHKKTTKAPYNTMKDSTWSHIAHTYFEPKPLY
jgi:hypothetical protein